MKPQFTPGPWTVSLNNQRSPTIMAGDHAIAHVCELSDSGKPELANAHLMAAAPKLLQQLEQLIEVIDDGNAETPATSRWPDAHETIAQAHGITCEQRIIATLSAQNEAMLEVLSELDQFSKDHFEDMPKNWQDLDERIQAVIAKVTA